MKRTNTTDFEREAISTLLKTEIEDEFEKEFLMNGDYLEQISPKQRLTLWGIFFKQYDKFPENMQKDIYQVYVVSEAIKLFAIDDIEKSTSNLVYRLNRTVSNNR